MRARLLATLICGAIAATAGATAAPATAKGPPIPLAIGGVVVEGAPSDALQPAVTRAVRIGLGAPETGPDLGACITPDCLRATAQTVGAERVLSVSLVVSGEFHDQFVITIAVVDAQARPLRRRVDRCEGCPVSEATERVTALVADIAGAAQDDAVAVEITSKPGRAPLVVDGTDRGPAPWSGSLPAGPHTVVAGAVEHPFFLEANGEPQRIEVAVPTGPGRRRRFGPILTYGTAAVGAGTIVLGAVLLARDGDPTCARPSCPTLHDTALGGWLSVGGGVVLLGAAGYMFWNDRQSERPVFAVVPTASGAAAVAAGRF